MMPQPDRLSRMFWGPASKASLPSQHGIQSLRRGHEAPLRDEGHEESRGEVRPSDRISLLRAVERRSRVAVRNFTWTARKRTVHIAAAAGAAVAGARTQ